jgi:hypothetical protein
MNKCQTCEKETKNPKFCSRTCSAVASNKKSPKRKLEGVCSICDSPCNRRRKYCPACYERDIKNGFLGRNPEASIADMKRGGNANFQGLYPRIRELSRKKFLKSGFSMECAICGYSLHVDICHIKGINEHEETDMIKDVNHIDNLIPLCKNHHWELDNGHIEKAIVKAIVEDRKKKAVALSN